MNTRHPSHDAGMPHARCWNALPWYVNGTLTGEEAAALERHVAQCVACAAELLQQRALQAQLRDGDAVLMAPQSSWQKMVERLNREDEALARGVAPHSSRLRWAVAAQTLLIVGLTGAMWHQSREQSREQNYDARLAPQYETLTSSQGMPAARGHVRVVFGRDVTVNDVNALLHETRLQIVAGPTEAGVYTLAQPATSAAAQSETDVALKRLRADARVVFAEPDRR